MADGGMRGGAAADVGMQAVGAPGVGMQGASRGALAQGWTDVEGQLSGADPQAASTLGQELFAVADLFDMQVGLRRALSDPALDGRRKTGLVEAVLASRIDPRTLHVVSGLARSRWSRMRDLADATEILGMLAELLGAEMAGDVEEVEDELFRFGRIVTANSDLREALADRALPASRKAELIEALLEGKASPTTLALVTRVAGHPRGQTTEDALAEIGRVAAYRAQRLVAQVTTAVALSDDERERLRAGLARAYGRNVHLQVVVDPAVVGGVVVRIGDEIIDGSVAGRLEDARQQFG